MNLKHTDLRALCTNLKWIFQGFEFPGTPFTSALITAERDLFIWCQQHELVAQNQTSHHNGLNESCQLKSPRTTTSIYTKHTYGTDSSKGTPPCLWTIKSSPAYRENALILCQHHQGQLWSALTSEGQLQSRMGLEHAATLPQNTAKTPGMSPQFWLMLKRQKHSLEV